MCHKKIMRKRSSDHLPEGPPKKRISPGGNILPVSISSGEILTDLTGKQWKLGNSIGYGGFGEIYPASDNLNQPVKNDAPYVIKVESHTNGPLFVEIHCLLRIGRIDMINQWKSEHKMQSLGMIHYVASGSHVVDGAKIRFLVLPRYEQDLEKTFIAKQKKFNIKTVILICTQILDVLEYIHSKGYVHCDIKASNILHSLQKNSPDINKVKQKENKPEQIERRDWNPMRTCRYKQSHGRNLRPKRAVNYVERRFNTENSKAADTEWVISPTVTDKQNPNQVFLIDYGLATKYRHPDGRHKQYCNDERKAHAGTIQFCSLDAHLGATSRRSDLESLGYNLLYWLTSNLPWSDLNNPEAVQKKKEEFFNNLEIFLNRNIQECPTFLYKYFEYVKSLTFESKPDYVLCKKLFLSALQEYEYKDDGCLDFDNVEGWGRKPRKEKTTTPVKTNRRTRRTKRTPLAAKNTPSDKPVLRKNKKLQKRKLNWWKMLSDPEELLRKNNKQNKCQEAFKSRERILTESSDTSCENTPSDKPVLRKNKKLQKRKLNWSKMLSDPEDLLRQNNKQNKSQEAVKSRERKLTESSDTSCVGNSVHNLDIWTLNPTYAMLEVFNRCKDRNANYNGPVKNGKGDGLSLEHRDGYTPAMDMVLTKMCQRQTEELENETDNYRNRYMTRTRSFRNNAKKTNSVKKGTKSSTSITKKIERKPITRSLRGHGLRG